MCKDGLKSPNSAIIRMSTLGIKQTKPTTPTRDGETLEPERRAGFDINSSFSCISKPVTYCSPITCCAQRLELQEALVLLV